MIFDFSMKSYSKFIHSKFKIIFRQYELVLIVFRIVHHYITESIGKVTL